jgi:hypothetical protein
MTHTRRCWTLAFGGVLVMFLTTVLAAAPESDTQPAAASDEKPKLVDEQGDIAEQYKRFEAVLLRMAELTAATDPRRAALLRQAVEQSKNRAINGRFDALIKFLQENRLALAVTNQEDLQKELQSLMELLLSENRQERLASEQARVKEYLKRVNKLIKDQKAIQGQSAGKTDPKQLAPKQGQLADDTGKLAKDIQANEEGKPDSDGNSKDGQPQEGEGKDGQKGENKPKPGEEGQKPKDGDKPGEQKPSEQKPGEQKPGEQGQQGENQKGQEGKPQEGKPQPGKPQKGQPGEQGEQGEPSDGQQQQQQNQQSDEQNPARKRIQAAEEKMRQAQEKLEQAKRKDAVEEQEQAIRELEQAKAELERILRQLREEEIERMLAQLEARFRKMLQIQVEVYEGTLRLDKVPQARRGRNEEIEAGRLSRREAEIALEAEKALALLREEGSAVAMPEAVSQMHEDMQDVVVRLAQTKVDRRTQGLEEDIIAALEEMIEALQKAQKEMEDQKQQQQQQQQRKQEKALIDQIAELKMIRSLQLRVNRRTQRYADLIEGQEQAVEPDLVEAVRELGEREQRVYKATRDIVVGRNQ